jgi:hypothetical protein
MRSTWDRNLAAASLFTEQHLLARVIGHYVSSHRVAGVGATAHVTAALAVAGGGAGQQLVARVIALSVSSHLLYRI